MLFVFRKMYSLAVIVLVLTSFRFSNACFACGICSTGRCNVPPPPPPMCGGCGQGYGCGSYGCYRMRAQARGSHTIKIENEKAALSALTPDEKFMKCCEDRNLPDACMAKCTYGTYTRMALQNMYFKLDQCPMQAAADIHFCAAQGRDHRDCCYRNGVSTTLAGPKCLTFCDQRPGNITQLDLTYLACYDRFENMKSCFYYEMSQGEGLNLPPVSIPALSTEENPEGMADMDEESDVILSDRSTADSNQGTAFLGSFAP